VAELPGVRALSGQGRDVVVRQDGVASVAQLVGWGVSSAAVRRKVAAGHWRRAFRGVVVLQSGPTSWRQRARAALLYCGPDAALSHESAAFHHGILTEPGRSVVVTVPHTRTVMPQLGLVVHRSRTMPWAGGRLRSVEPAEAILGIVTTTTSAHSRRSAPPTTTSGATTPRSSRPERPRCATAGGTSP